MWINDLDFIELAWEFLDIVTYLNERLELYWTYPESYCTLVWQICDLDYNELTVIHYLRFTTKFIHYLRFTTKFKYCVLEMLLVSIGYTKYKSFGRRRLIFHLLNIFDFIDLDVVYIVVVLNIWKRIVVTYLIKMSSFTNSSYIKNLFQ